MAAAVPVSFSLALFVNWQAGFTINRVTLFALILSLGLVVDDPITNVDNIQRHLRMGRKRPVDATLDAVVEVLPPVIMSTLAIIVSFTPMFFITGMMGPYMGPMAINVPLTVSFSTVSALTFVPWLAFLLLRKKYGNRSELEHVEAEADPTPEWIKKVNHALVSPFIKTRARSYGLLGLIVLLLLASGGLAVLRKVPLKMLPFDNKNEMQLVLDMPEGTPLEVTDAAVRRFEDYLRGVEEVTDFQSFVGVPSPIDFNGMVRHYYFRGAPNLADVRFNLLPKDRRTMQSHAIGMRIRNDLQAIARAVGAKLKIVEVPPGPPVLATVVAEIYGKPDTPYSELIAASGELQKRMEMEPGVVDVDDMAQTPHDRWAFEVDRVKAALLGVDVASIVESLHVALRGQMAGTLHDEAERQPLEIEIRLAEGSRSGVEELLSLEIKARSGRNVSLRELGRFVRKPEDQTIYHKNLKPVVFVLAEMAGRAPGEAILDLQADLEKNPLPQDVRIGLGGRRGVAHHPPRLPGSGHRLRRGPHRDLHPRGGRDEQLLHAPDHHERHSPDGHRHHARLLAHEHGRGRSRGRLSGRGLLHRHGHDRHDRPGGNRGAQLHRPHRVHRGCAARGEGPARGDPRCGGGALPSHHAHRGDHGSGGMAHHLRSHLLGTGLGPHLRALRLDGVHPGRHPRRVQSDLRSNRRREGVMTCPNSPPAT